MNLSDYGIVMINVKVPLPCFGLPDSQEIFRLKFHCMIMDDRVWGSLGWRVELAAFGATHPKNAANGKNEGQKS